MTMIRMADSAGFLGVDWGAIAVVCVAALLVTVIIVTFYSVGLRLLAVGAPGARPAVATAGGWLCIAVGAVAVLYGVYLVIPVFH